MKTVVCREHYGSSQLKREYVKCDDGSLKIEQESQKLTSTSQFFRSVFLPQGYPESVSSDYLTYQVWDTVQAFCSSITGSLAMQAVLQGVGVGDDSASILAATLTWIMKDGTGMLGRIIFAWAQGTYLDCDCKRWRLFADILNDCAICLEILAPLSKNYFRLIVFTSGVAKSIVGVAGGATRAALTQHQARRNNMADVSAKDGSQETLVNLTALLCNLVLIPLVTGHQGFIWTLFLIFTALHLFANYKAVTNVTMETFNQARLHLVVQEFLGSSVNHVMSVEATNQKEPVLWKQRRKLHISLGASLQSLFRSSTDTSAIFKIYQEEKHMINVNLRKATLHIALHDDATEADHLKSCFEAEVIEFALSNYTQSQPQLADVRLNLLLQNLFESVRYGDAVTLLSQARRLTEMAYGDFRSAAVAQGWLLEKPLLRADEWRSQWNSPSLEDKKAF